MQPSQKRTGMGIPQNLCREMHQSGRDSTILEIRSLPKEGIQETCAIAFRSFSLKPRCPTFKNHCSVALKITGFLHLQQ